jgi:SAM-dependent methyltransferase
VSRDPKERFSDRVDDYVRYRPGYPPGVRDLLARVARLGPGRVVADVGSGTGIFTELLLETGAHVIGVEPNLAMREAAERALAAQLVSGAFESKDASAEATGLAQASVALVAAAQAFHWFDPPRARAEFVRILEPGGQVALVWNQRKDTPLNLEYEAMLERFAPDYANVRERDRAAEPRLVNFFSPAAASRATFENEQRLDAAGLRGRLDSSSYAPRPSSPLYAPMMETLDAIFRAHEAGGIVTIAYETVVWYGGLEA